MTFNIPDAQRDLLLEAHELILSKIDCNTHPEIPAGVKSAFGFSELVYRDIGDNVPCDVRPGFILLGCYYNSRIWLNFAELASSESLAKTVIHEIMHSCGYDHPERPDPDDLSHPYYSSIPVLAELCIDGGFSAGLL